MSLRQKVSSAIRILRWNRDVSARASHLVEVFNFQAGSGNVSGSTFSERKNMSTKTSFKRIAAVAAVALALGGFSAVSANATTTTMAAYATATNATWSVTQGSSASVGFTTAYAGSTVSTAGTQVVGGIATVTFYETATPGAVSDAELLGNVTSAGVGSVVSLGTGVVTGGTFGAPAGYALGSTTTAATFPSSTLSLAATSTASTAAASVISVPVNVSSQVAGTQTLSFTPITTNGVPGTPVTATITWGSAPVVSAQFSTAYIASSNTPATSITNASPVGGPAALVALGTTGQLAGNILVTLKSSATATINAGISDTISGPGNLGYNAGPFITSTAIGRAISATADEAAANNVYDITVWSDGTAGTGTITITSGSTTIATKTVTFYGSAKALTATQNLNVLKAGGSSGAVTTGNVYNGPNSAYSATTVLVQNPTAGVTTGLAPITVYTKDTAGNPSPITVVYGTNIKVVSSDTTVLTPVTCVNVTASTTADGVTTNEINCVVTGTVGAASGKTATATVELYNSTTAAWDILATPLTFSIGGSIAKEVLSTDASAYVPNQPLKLTVTATDSSGNPAYDQDQTLVGLITASTYMNNLASPTMLIGGTSTKKNIYAPLVEGDFTISGLDASALNNAVSVTATVGNFTATNASQAATDAAQEATDAANAAYDAANNAMDSADAATAAAQDASDNASAALAAVTSLSATVAKLVSSVTAIATALAAIKKKLGVK